MFDTINHVAIIVSDLNISKKFYIDKLGFELMQEINRGSRGTITYLDAGNIIIELFCFPDAPKRLSYPEACGLRHLALNTNDFDDVVKKLNEANVETEPVRIDEKTRKRMTFFKDPDGLPLEICES